MSESRISCPVTFKSASTVTIPFAESVAVMLALNLAVPSAAGVEPPAVQFAAVISTFAGSRHFSILVVSSPRLFFVLTILEFDSHYWGWGFETDRGP